MNVSKITFKDPAPLADASKRCHFEAGKDGIVAIDVAPTGHVTILYDIDLVNRGINVSGSVIIAGNPFVAHADVVTQTLDEKKAAAAKGAPKK